MTPKRGKARKVAKKLNRATTSGATTTLEQFLAATGTLTALQRAEIVAQGEVMLQALYGRHRSSSRWRPARSTLRASPSCRPTSTTGSVSSIRPRWH